MREHVLVGLLRNGDREVLQLHSRPIKLDTVAWFADAREIQCLRRPLNWMQPRRFPLDPAQIEFNRPLYPYPVRAKYQGRRRTSAPPHVEPSFTPCIESDGVGPHLGRRLDPLYARISRRILPLLQLGYIVAYLDRVSVGFAKLQMLEDLQFSETVYGLGAGIYFLGYFLFEVPSNVMLHRVGADRWIARIMISWGVLSTAMMFVNHVDSVLRPSLPARHGRSRILPRHHLLPHPMVPGRAPRPRDGHFHDRRRPQQ